MYKCVKCVSAFTRKDNLMRHEKTHEGVRLPCTICTSTFKYKFHLKRHMKTVHGMHNILFILLIYYDFYFYLFIFFFKLLHTYDHNQISQRPPQIRLEM